MKKKNYTSYLEFAPIAPISGSDQKESNVIQHNFIHTVVTITSYQLGFTVH
jgi:hypothetical protein